MADTIYTVAVFNASDDTVEMLDTALSDGGFRIANGHVSDVKRGKTDSLALIAHHDPEVVLWDISPPYDKNWNFCMPIRASSILDGRSMVGATTHKKNLDALRRGDSGAIEIVGKPYDLGLIAQAVKDAIPAARRAI